MCVTSGGREVDVGGEGHIYICCCAPPPLRPHRVHLTSYTWLMRPGLPRFLRSSASVYYTERKLKNKKRGRPGNEAIAAALDPVWDFGVQIAALTLKQPNLNPAVCMASLCLVIFMYNACSMEVCGNFTHKFNHLNFLNWHTLCIRFYPLLLFTLLT